MVPWSTTDMTRLQVSRRLLALLVCLSAGCAEKQPNVGPRTDNSTLIEKVRADLPLETRRLYDAAVAKTLVGARASDYQAGLDAAKSVSRDERPNAPLMYYFCFGDAATYGEGPLEMSVNVTDGEIVSSFIWVEKYGGGATAH
jgi:hypothetical protein